MSLRMGISGFGGMGNLHNRVYSAIDGVEFVAAYDIDPKRLDQAKEAGLTAYETLDAFLADDRINFVLVATPNHVHKELAIAAMRAGKNVMVEKPATITSADFEELIEVSKECGVVLTCHHNRRFDRDYLTVRKIIEDGLIGKPFAIMSSVHAKRGEMHGWRCEKQYGGGMVLDWGVHLFDQILTAFPEKKITSVFAQTASIKNPGVEDFFKVQMTMDNDLFVEVEAGTYCLKPHDRWVVFGDQGAFNIKDFACTDGGITTTDYELANQSQGDIVVLTPAGPTRTMSPLPAGAEYNTELPLIDVSKEGLVAYEDNGAVLYSRLYKNLVDVVDNGAELLVKPKDILRNIKFMEAVFESAEKGQSLTINL